MPLLDPPRASEAAASRWRSTISKATTHRVDATRLRSVFSDLSLQTPIPTTSLVDLLLECHTADGSADDPLLFSYIAELLNLDLLTTTSVLHGILGHSDVFKHDDQAVRRQRGSESMPGFEERVLQILAADYSSRKARNAEARQLQTGPVTFALSQWLNAAREFETSQSLTSHGLQSPITQLRIGIYDALSMLVICVFGDPNFKEVQKYAWWKEKRGMIRNVVASFVVQVGQWITPANHNHLQTLLNLQPFLEMDENGFPRLSDELVRNSVADLPLVTSRASTFVWLTACLYARPVTDDVTMMQILHSRGSENIQSAAVDLLVASFEVLTNGMLNRESKHSVRLIRSFICNRLPPLLASIAAMLLPLSAGQCIQMAFNHINIDPLPPLTAGANDIREQLKITRLEFLQACALQSIVSESIIAVILQEPIALPKVVKYNREKLAQQCSQNTGKIESLVGELSATQGNAGAIAGCIIDLVNNACNSKDTMSLRTVCMALIKHVPAIDIILQYAQPMQIMLPICNLLNNWVHEQDQSELQPPYEEFATILLLVLAVFHRYDLKDEEIGLMDSNSFIPNVIRRPSISSALEDLSDVQKTRLAKWIEGLYATDEQDETFGINDEVMSQCPPEAFYELVPTLFEQSVLGRKSNAISSTTLQGGLELLLEPFLLPSLVGGLSWMVKYSWEDHGNADILFSMLDKLLKPSSSSTDTQAMHKAILNIVGTSLSQSIEQFKRKSTRKDINGFLDILKPHVNQQRALRADYSELQQWATSSEGDFQKVIRASIHAMVEWITSVGPDPPPRFSYKLYATSVDLVGAEAVLDAMVDEVSEQTIAGKGAEALDVCAAIICAPSPDRVAGSALQALLQLQSINTNGLLDAPTSRSEATIRLQRRVDSYQAAILTVSASIAIPMQDQATDQIMQDLGLAPNDSVVNASSTIRTDSQTQDGDITFDGKDLTSQLGQTMGDTGANANNNINSMPGLEPSGSADQMQDIFGDLGVLGGTGGDVNSQGNGGDISQQNQEDDIFAGLDMDLADFTDDYNFG